MVGTVGSAFLAGLLSVRSPGVLPPVPIVRETAVSEHRLGPVAPATGLAVAFTALGLFAATAGFAIGLDGDVFRRAGAVLLVIAGAILMPPRLQAQAATAAGPMGPVRRSVSAGPVIRPQPGSAGWRTDRPGSVWTADETVSEDRQSSTIASSLSRRRPQELPQEPP